MKSLTLVILAVLLASPTYAQSTLYSDPTTGNVGIGTASPGTALDVNGAFTERGMAAPSVSAAGQGIIYFDSTANEFEVSQDGSAYAPLPGFGGAFSNGQLQRGGSTTLSFCPYKGNIKTTASQGNYTIPSSCLTATITSMYKGGTASQSLSANTLYYIYLWNHSGTWVLDAETTGHATNTTTGVEQESGDATKTLVGMVYPQTGPVLVDSTTARLVASWDNRVPKYLANGFSTTRSTTSTSEVEINSEIRGYFLTWGDAFNAAYAGLAYNSTNGGTAAMNIDLDGSTLLADAEVNNSNATTNYDNISISTNYATTEGMHYVTIFGGLGAGGVGTASWYGGFPNYHLSWLGII